MSMRPETFEAELNARCGTRERPYRLRRGIVDPSQWFIEQKVSRAFEVPADGNPDVRRRVTDGYGFVIAFHRTPVIECPQCHFDVHLPHLAYGEIKCEYCHTHPESFPVQIFHTGYFPLCDRLLTKVEETAPKREGKWIDEMDARNRAIKARLERAAHSVGLDVAHDWRNQIGNVPRVGYGKGPASFGRV